MLSIVFTQKLEYDYIYGKSLSLKCALIPSYI